jgi:hypothetical protein
MSMIGPVEIHRWRHEWRKMMGSDPRLWGKEVRPPGGGGDSRTCPLFHEERRQDRWENQVEEHVEKEARALSGNIPDPRRVGGSGSDDYRKTTDYPLG